MERTPEIVRIQRPDRILSYLRPELWSLGLMTVTGIAYNIGMTAGPYFEGLLAGCLLEVLQGRKGPGDMLRLAGVYLAVILLVQYILFKRRQYRTMCRKVREQWGKIPDREYSLEEFEKISHYFKNIVKTKGY